MWMREAVPDRSSYPQAAGLGPDDRTWAAELVPAQGLRLAELGQAPGAWPAVVPEEAWVVVAHIGPMDPG